MNQLERVARALATAFNNDAWERFVDKAQAAIDAMQPDIEAAERNAERAADAKAREDCAARCEKRADSLREGSAIARQCAKDIRGSIYKP